MSKQMSVRVGEIDLFRFLFSVIILCRHAEYLLGENLVFPGGAFAVEFFFLVSGYLMMASLDKYREKPIEDLSKETISFLKKKASAIYPEFFLSFIIGFAIQCLCKALPWKKIGELFMASIFELLLLQRTGIGLNSVNGVIWYVQSMLLCMAILYPLIRKYPEMMKRIIMPLTALLLLGYLQKNYVHLRAPSKWLGVTYKGNIRAMAELCLGAECFFATKYIKRFQLNKLAKSILTLIKWSCWLLVIVYMWDSKWKQDIFMLVVFCVAVILAFSQQCMDTAIYQNKLVVFLGKFSLPVYLCHIFYARSLPYVLPESLRYRTQMVCYMACAFLTAFVVMGLAQIIRKVMPSVKEKMKQIFLEESQRSFGCSNQE